MQDPTHLGAVAFSFYCRVLHTLEHALSDTPDIAVCCAYIRVTGSHAQSNPTVTKPQVAALEVSNMPEISFFDHKINRPSRSPVVFGCRGRNFADPFACNYTTVSSAV
jgi:hypothetical protein